MAPTEGSLKFELPWLLQKGSLKFELPWLLQKDPSSLNYQPTMYTIVPAVAMKKESIVVPRPPNEINSINGKLIDAKSQEKDWISHALRLIDNETLHDKRCNCLVSLPCLFTASSEIVLPALTQLFPLFYEKAATVAMIKHGLI